MNQIIIIILTGFIKIMYAKCFEQSSTILHQQQKHQKQERNFSNFVSFLVSFPKSYKICLMCPKCMYSKNIGYYSNQHLIVFKPNIRKRNIKGMQSPKNIFLKVKESNTSGITLLGPNEMAEMVSRFSNFPKLFFRLGNRHIKQKKQQQQGEIKLERWKILCLHFAKVSKIEDWCFADLIRLDLSF